MKQARNFFTDEEKTRIETAVRKAETKTSGEIVPMLVDESYDYPRAEIVGGGCFAMGGALLLAWAFGGSSEWVFLPLFLLLYLPCKLLVRSIPALRRALTPEAEMSAEVEERALVAFVEHGLHRTRDANGILILVSLFEHRVRVLADSGISAVVPAGIWDEVVAGITAGIHEGRTADAFCAAIERCGELLATHFPPRAGDRNELPDLIV